MLIPNFLKFFFKKSCSTFNCPIYEVHINFLLALMKASLLRIKFLGIHTVF